MNVDGRQFIRVGFPMGVAFEFDSRCVVTPDVDLDGRPDLLLVRQDWTKTPRGIVARQRLLVFKNRLETDNHWIGVHLRSGRLGSSPIGARVVLQTRGRRHERVVVTGDSYFCQVPATVHFGLGTQTQVDHILVKWPRGEMRLDQPKVDRYHVITLGKDEEKEK